MFRARSRKLTKTAAPRFEGSLQRSVLALQAPKEGRTTQKIACRANLAYAEITRQCTCTMR